MPQTANVQAGVERAVGTTATFAQQPCIASFARQPCQLEDGIVTVAHDTVITLWLFYLRSRHIFMALSDTSISQTVKRLVACITGSGGLVTAPLACPQLNASGAHEVGVCHRFDIRFGYDPPHAVLESGNVCKTSNCIHRSWRSAGIPAPPSIPPDSVRRVGRCRSKAGKNSHQCQSLLLHR